MHKQVGQLERLPLNRYEAVLIAAKRARSINQRLKRQKEAAMITPGLVEPEIDENIKITVQALEDLVGGKIKYSLPPSGKTS